jgi:hypothetical protein
MSNNKFQHSVEENGIVYKIVEPNDYPRMVDFYFQMMEDEPCNESQNVQFNGNYPKGMLEEVQNMIKEGVSLMATEEKTDQIVGLRFGYLVNRYLKHYLKSTPTGKN